MLHGNVEYIKSGNCPRLDLLGYKISIKKLMN